MSKIKIHVLHTGSVRVDRALPFKSRSLNPLAFMGIFRSKRNQIWLPVSAYLIEHPKGLILFDTGWNRAVSPHGEYNRWAQVKHMSLIHYVINKGFLPLHQAIDEQLGEMGIKPSDLDYVILSHLHTDHASGLSLVKEAKQILVSEDELNDTLKYPLRYASRMWKGIDFKTFSFEMTGVGPFGQSFDLFGDGSIQLVKIAGHTHGMVAMKIQQGDKFVLLFADGGYAQKSWREMITPGTALNNEWCQKSLHWIKEMSLNESCIESLANHDSQIIPHTIEL